MCPGLGANAPPTALPHARPQGLSPRPVSARSSREEAASVQLLVARPSEDAETERDIGQPATPPGPRAQQARALPPQPCGSQTAPLPSPREPRWTAGPGSHTCPAPLWSGGGGGRTLQLGRASTWHTFPSGRWGRPLPARPRPRLGEPLTRHAQAPVPSPSSPCACACACARPRPLRSGPEHSSGGCSCRPRRMRLGEWGLWGWGAPPGSQSVWGQGGRLLSRADTRRRPSI